MHSGNAAAMPPDRNEATFSFCQASRSVRTTIAILVSNCMMSPTVIPGRRDSDEPGISYLSHRDSGCALTRAPEAVRARNLDESRRRVPVMRDIGDIQESCRRHHTTGEGDALGRSREDLPEPRHVDAFDAVESDEMEQHAVMTE